MMKIFYYLFCLSLLVSGVFAQQSDSLPFQRDAVLRGDVQVFPLTLVKAFPFISGEVNGVKGKFMLDTGNGNTIEINNNLVPLKNEKPIGRGIVQSGQTFKTFINDSIEEVKFNDNLIYRNLAGIRSSNLDFLQNHITPDCLGYVGYGFFKDYLMKLDYQRSKVIFYKNTPERAASKDFLKGEKIIAVLDYEVRKLPNHPLMKVKIGGADVLASFDTGTYGEAQFDEKTMKYLLDKGLLAASGTDGEGDALYDLNQISVLKNLKVTTPAIDLEEVGSPSPFKEADGITESNVLTFGYRLFVQFKTVWDFKNKKIYLLKN